MNRPALVQSSRGLGGDGGLVVQVKQREIVNVAGSGVPLVLICLQGGSTNSSEGGGQGRNSSGGGGGGGVRVLEKASPWEFPY